MRSEKHRIISTKFGRNNTYIRMIYAERFPDNYLCMVHGVISTTAADIPQNYAENETIHKIANIFTEFLSKIYVLQIVYIVRNPRDTVVSFYHFMKMVGYIGYDGNIEAFLDLFIAGNGN